MAENEGVRVPVDRVREQIEAVFRAWGMSEEWIPDSVGVLGRADDSSVARAVLILHEKAFAAYAEAQGRDWAEITSQP